MQTRAVPGAGEQEILGGFLLDEYVFPSGQIVRKKAVCVLVQDAALSGDGYSPGHAFGGPEGKPYFYNL